MLSACIEGKEKITPTWDLSQESADEITSFRLAQSGFTIVYTEELGGELNDVYTQGIIEYVKDEQVLARVEFGGGTAEDKAKYTIDGVDYDLDLKVEDGYEDDYEDDSKDDEDCDGDCDYDDEDDLAITKVIVQPIVKSEDCNFIVAGIIEFYDSNTGALLATVDFGDGTCDDIAEKTDESGNVTSFAVSEFF